jgi:hypothetical protein
MCTAEGLRRVFMIRIGGYGSVDDMSTHKDNRRMRREPRQASVE